jgi:hypothetical protein
MIRHKVIVDIPADKSLGDSKLIRSHNRLKELLPLFKTMNENTPRNQYLSVLDEITECKKVTRGLLITTITY